MSEVNVPLLRKAVEWAEAENSKPPELCEWFQGSWVINAPGDTEYDYRDEGVRRTLGLSPECGTCFCIAGYVQYVTTGSKDGAEAEWTAAKQLGLSYSQANKLFGGENGIEDVRRIAEKIAGEKL